MPSLIDRIHEDPASSDTQLDVHLAEVPTLLASLLPELVTLAGECETVATTRHHTGPGFLSPEAALQQNQLVQKERQAQHENRTLALKLTGPIPAPVSVAATSLVAEIDQFLYDIVDDLDRRLTRYARVCLLTEPWRGPRDRALTRAEASAYAVDLVAIYTRPAELRRQHAEGEDLGARARRFLDGVQTVAHDEPCPWCGHRTLVANLTTGVIRCESDRATSQRLPCICSDRYCACRTTGHRHEWHRDVLKADPAPGEARHRLRSQTWHGLRDLFRDRARTATSTTTTEE